MNYNAWVVPIGLHKPRLFVSDPQPVTTFLLPFVLYFPMTESKPKIEEGSQFFFSLFMLDPFPATSLLMSFTQFFLQQNICAS